MNKPVLISPHSPLPLSDARRLTQRVHFERDGTVSIITGKVELGQGITTALAQIAADELGVDLHKVKMLPVSTAYSPDEGVTSGSLSIQDGGKGLRKACAELRQLLKKSGKKSYWELEVAGSEIPADAPEKAAADYKVVGTSAPRVDLPAKFAGRPSYVHDMVLPGMLHARVVRPPWPYTRVDLASVSLRGQTLVKSGNFVGILAEREELAIEGAKQLRAKLQWTKGPEAPADIYAWLKEHVAENNIAKEKVDAAAKARGVKRLQAEYRKPFICHASIGPSCAVARMQGEKLEVWSHTQGIFGLRRELAPAVNPALPAGGADRNAIPAYDFPDLLVMNHYVREMPVRGSSLRSLGGFGNVFAIESFMDELAGDDDKAGFRLRHLKDPRGRAVMEEAVRRSHWNAWQRAEGKGHGIAFAKYKNLGAYCAVVAEVDVTHELRVTRLVAAVDVGLPVNPDGVMNQIEGGCVQAASWTLKEAWRPGVAGWEDYPILRFSDAPPVEVHLLKNNHPSVGAGECTMGPTAAAIANALHDALGVRVRELPLTPERIAEAINA